MKRGLYPVKTEAQKDGYKVTVRWHGVFDKFYYEVAQGGDSKGEVILEVNKYRWRVGPKLLLGFPFFYGRESNLECYEEIRGVLVHRAANDNIALDIKILDELLIEALSPYSTAAKLARKIIA